MLAGLHAEGSGAPSSSCPDSMFRWWQVVAVGTWFHRRDGLPAPLPPLGVTAEGRGGSAPRVERPSLAGQSALDRTGGSPNPPRKNRMSGVGNLGTMNQ